MTGSYTMPSSTDPASQLDKSHFSGCECLTGGGMLRFPLDSHSQPANLICLQRLCILWALWRTFQML